MSASRIIVPIVLGAVAGVAAVAGAIVASRGVPDRALPEPSLPLPFDGWWNSRDSSAIAYAHPAVLFVDAASGELIDSWDRRSASRVTGARVSRVGSWPAEGTIVLDALTGDLLATVPQQVHG